GLNFFNGVSALTWFIVGVIAFTTATTLGGRKEYYRSPCGYTEMNHVHPTVVWLEAMLAHITSGMLWAQVILSLYYRRRFLKKVKRSQTSTPETPIPLEKHEKWIFGSIIACIIMSFVDLGISFGDGGYGKFSSWLIPAAAILTLLFHTITLVIWRSTAKERMGTTIPPSIYSQTLIVADCVLVVVWITSSVLAFVRVRSDKYNYEYWDWRYYGRQYGLRIVTRQIAAGIAVAVSCVLLIQLGLIIHYRKRFFDRLIIARNRAPSIPGTKAPKNSSARGTTTSNDEGGKIANPINASPNVVHQAPVSPLIAEPSIPNPVYSPQYIVQQPQEQAPAPVFVPYAPLPHNSYPVYNPVYQPSYPHMGIVPGASMIQKDEGK
ncbi:hypothetical protein FRC17_004988, partial [Serendipita sp. 399]